MVDQRYRVAVGFLYFQPGMREQETHEHALHELRQKQRKLCMELLGGVAACVFVRAGWQCSLKASELPHAVMFHRHTPHFIDLGGCVVSFRFDIWRLPSTPWRAGPSKADLLVTVAYDRRT